MAHTLDDAYPPAVRPQAAGDSAKLQDEIHRLSQRLVRARESYDQDLFGGDAEVPLEEQLAVIATYTARLESLNAQLHGPDAGAPASEVPDQASYTPPPQPAPPQVPEPWVPQPAAAMPQPAMPQPAEPPARRAAIPGPGISSPDGTPLVSDGTLLRTEEAAIGEYVRYAAEQRWLATSRRSLVDEYAAICDRILAALAHKHGVTVEDERQSLVRHVDARFRRDYG